MNSADLDSDRSVRQIDRLVERSVAHFLLSHFNGLRRSNRRHQAIANNLRSGHSLFKGAQ